MQIYNSPSDVILKNSLEAILQKSFANTGDKQTCLYLVGDAREIKSLGTTLKLTVPSDLKVVVNTLSLRVGFELRGQQTQLEEQGITIISDYSNPSNDYQDKSVFFYSSEDCRPFINHVYSEVTSGILPLIVKYHGFIAPIGSDLLPDFPCKLDTDILVCIPNKRDCALFCKELAENGIFIAPPQTIGALHTFFYAQLLGSPIDLHVYNSSLEENPLYRQTEQLQHNTELRERYKQFKFENEGAKASDYRKAKAAFRQRVGWAG